MADVAPSDGVDGVAPARVTVRYFAAARAAAGTEDEIVEITEETTIDGLLERLRERGADLSRVLERCSFLCDGVAVRDRSIRLTTNQTVDVLPPFAGG
ncbi:MoaD/ThiS family protein [Mycolicibacterium lacusdiani]|uniref:MoaD/ThiS family protein n=1 Tax=Mycolicibacterium lacusdiani TaxID=2895283 RepID=UPI0027E0E85B|nr:MoaD/ThiS family protein [Mycolicibacterium lacusdiani]